MGAVLIIGAILAAGSAVEARKSRKDARKARKIDERRNKLQTQRSSAEQVRQAQIARSQIVQNSENQGVGGSSAAVGGAGSVQSQAGGNITFAQQIFGLQQSSNRLRESAFSHTGKSQAFGSIAALSQTEGGEKAINKVFG